MTDFTVNDHRFSAGLVVGESVSSAREAMSGQSITAEQALRAGRSGPAPTDQDTLSQMHRSRMKSFQRTAGVGYGGGGMQFATQRPDDITFYWRQNNLPFKTETEADLEPIRAFCRLIYKTHPVVASAIDIFTKYPVLGAEFTSKDQSLVDFYSTLFFDQLNYEDYLLDIGREYWTVGEVFPLGSFNDDLGVWEADELLNPDDVFVEKSPFMREPHFSIRLPESLRHVLQTGRPRHEYDALVRSYPELMHFTSDQARMPVSSILLKQMKFKADTFHKRGMPIMMRMFRSLRQEEMLNAAQDAIAERLYTPLILAKIGASASDLGTQRPWVPTREQIDDFNDSLDTALAADFRVLTTHFAVQMESVFGRESMPNFDADFERLTERELQVFGLSQTMLSGAGQGETYAADALNRDLVSQLLETYQRMLKRLVHDRMLVVAEAQEHYDYEVRGGKRYPIMEEVLVVDEQGDKRIVEQPKLLVPELQMRSMNMRSDDSMRQFFEALRASGVPISMRSRMVNIPVDLDDEIDTSREEQVKLAVEAQETRKETYLALRAKNLPIPADLAQDFAPKAKQPDEMAGTADARLPQLGVDDVDSAALAPTPEVLQLPPGTPTDPTQTQEGPGGEMGQVIPLPRNKVMSRPPESDEMRATMPKPASVKVAGLNEDGDPADVEVTGGLISGPAHVGRRRFLGITEDTELGDDEQLAEPESVTVR